MTDADGQRDPAEQQQRRRRSGLRKNSFAISVMLLVQYGLGVGVSIYVKVPEADQGGGLFPALGRALTSRPVVLAIHSGFGLLMLVAGVTVLTRAVLARHRPAITFSALGLTALIGAGVGGAMFVDTDRDGASMAMAVLTGVAFLSYLLNLLIVAPDAAARDERGRP